MNNLYPRIGRGLFYVIRALAKPFGIKMRRTRCLVTVGDEVLLVRNWLGRQRWNLPGGGIHPGETEVIGAVRELHEELGITIEPAQLRPLGVFKYDDGAFREALPTFLVRLKAKPPLKVSRFELIDGGWFRLTDLPEPQSPLVAWALERAGLSAVARKPAGRVN